MEEERTSETSMNCHRISRLHIREEYYIQVWVTNKHAARTPVAESNLYTWKASGNCMYQLLLR